MKRIVDFNKIWDYTEEKYDKAKQQMDATDDLFLKNKYLGEMGALISLRFFILKEYKIEDEKKGGI